MDWLLAKYVPNLERNEPINVGLVLFYENQVRARFLGETSTGDFSPQCCHVIQDMANYRDWVDHWRRLVSNGAPEEEFLKDPPKHSFYMERAGRRILGNENPEDTFNELFEKLVRR